jgi:hypothetical protein
VTCEDCDDVAIARGLCDTCYSRAIKAGSIRVLYPNVTPGEVERMTALRRRGLGWLLIGRAVGRCPTTVRRHMQAVGL